MRRFRDALDLTRAIALLLSVGLLVVVWTRVQADEQKTCRIQQRGLPAAREQQQAMFYLYRVLEDKPSRAQQTKQVPPTRQQQHDLVELRRHLRAYTLIESQQPRSRVC